MIFSAHGGIVTPSERPHAAMRAKDVVDAIGLVVFEIGAAGDQPEIGWRHDGSPQMGPSFTSDDCI